MAMTTGSCQQPCRASTCPSWLQAALTDIEQRVQSVSLQQPESETSDSFAERAENYYQKRPQLLSLLHDLHNRYLYLADRYSQSLQQPKHFLAVPRCPSAASSDIDFDSNSDVESSLSFQPLPTSFSVDSIVDPVAVSLVMALVEKDVLADLASGWEKRQREWSRKVDLQRSLVEVLESERMVLAAENARLAFRASASEEEGRALAAEVGYMRKKAGELARCVARMREGQRACAIGRRVEGLERQVFGLEKRNREWYETMSRREREEEEAKSELKRLREENWRLRLGSLPAEGGGGGKGWWGWVRGFRACGTVGGSNGSGKGRRGRRYGGGGGASCSCL